MTLRDIFPGWMFLQAGKGRLIACLLLSAAVCCVSFEAGNRSFARKVSARSPGRSLREDELEPALQKARLRLNANPKDPRAFFELGMLQFRQGRPQYIEAAKNLEAARELGALDARIFYCLGVIYQQLGLYEYAGREYARFLNNYPDDRETGLLLGKIYYTEGRFAEAAEEFEKLKLSSPRDLIVLENLALSLWKNKEEEKAFRVLAEMRGLGGYAARRADFSAGQFYFEQARYDKTAELCGNLLQTSAEDKTMDLNGVRKLLAKACAGLGRRESALGLWEEILRSSPGDAEAQASIIKLRKALKTAKRSQEHRSTSHK